MLRGRLTLFAAVFLLVASTPPASAAIYLGADLATWWNGTEAENAPLVAGNDPNENSTGFGDPAANLHLHGDVFEGVDAYLEIYLLPDPAGILSSTGRNRVVLNQGYLRVRDRLAWHELGPVDLTVGKFELDFGDRHRERSDNAEVQDNPLIGNGVLDPTAKQAGVEVSGALYGPALQWVLAVTNGTTLTAFEEDAGFAAAPKLYGRTRTVLPGTVSYAVSAYAVDHTGSFASATDNLFRAADASSLPGLNHYQGFAVPTFSLTGRDVKAWQVDVGWENGTLEVDGWRGSYKDEDFTSLDVAYYGLEAVYRATPYLHGALRYSTADESPNTFFSDDQVERLQAGVGYALNEHTLAKLEWVDQTAEGFGVGGEDLESRGVTAELSASF